MSVEKTEFKFDPKGEYTREQFIFGFEAIIAQNFYDKEFVEELKKQIEWAQRTVAENEIIRFHPETRTPYSQIRIRLV